MSWLLSGFNSIYDWLAPDAQNVLASRALLEEVRAAMLQSLGEAGAAGFVRLHMRVMMAVETDALWHLRPALMDALCRMHGEPHARRTLAAITALFGRSAPGGGARGHDAAWSLPR